MERGEVIGQGDEVDGVEHGAVVELVERPASGLRPFRAGDGRAQAAAARSAEVRRAKRAIARGASEDVAAELRRLAGTHQRGELGPIAAAAALDMIGRVVRGEQGVRDPADWVRVLVDVARLEAGEATSASVVAHLGAREVAALRDEARSALGAGPSSSVLAADDRPASGGGTSVD